MRVILYNKIVDDEVLSLHGIFPHIELKKLVYGILFAKGHPVDSHVGAYESAELVGRDLAETFESGYLGVVTEFVDCSHAFFVGIAVVCLLVGGILVASSALGCLAVAYTEQRSL